MTDSTTGRARPLVAVAYGPRCVPVMQLAEAAAGVCDLLWMIDTAVGSGAINEEFHPYDSEGRLQPNLSLLGVLTEGVRYFTHYLPSPRSRLRAVLDAQLCVESVID